MLTDIDELAILFEIMATGGIFEKEIRRLMGDKIEKCLLGPFASSVASCKSRIGESAKEYLRQPLLA